MRKIRAVFFDLDETLIDADYCHHLASQKAFALFGLNYDQAKQKSIAFDPIGRRINDILEVRRNALAINEKTLPLKKLCQVRENIFLKCISQKAKLFPGARQAIIHARKHAEIVAITSSGTRKYINFFLDKFKFKKYIDYIVGEQDVKKGKPNPEIYLKAFSLLPKKLKIKKQECLVVEDSINGVKAAQAAKFKVLFVPSKYTKATIKTNYQLKSLKNFNLTSF